MSVSFQTIEEGPNRIRILARFRERAPAQVYRDWTEPDRLHTWWGPEAVLDLRIGGEYVLRWEKFGVLRGRYSRIVPNKRLEFSWVWDDEPEIKQQVSLVFESNGESGTDLELTHGPYFAESRGQELRRHHLEGWRTHLSDLARSATTGA